MLFCGYTDAMAADRSTLAIARIEAALARIEAAPAKASDASEGAAAELAALRARHGQLRAAVQGSLQELDQLIEGAQTIDGAMG